MKYRVEISRIEHLTGVLKLRSYEGYDRISEEVLTTLVKSLVDGIEPKYIDAFDGPDYIEVYTVDSVSGLEKLNALVDAINQLDRSHRRPMSILQKFKRPVDSTEFFIDNRSSLVSTFKWLLKNCKVDEYRVIKKYGSATVLCIRDDKAMQYKLSME